MRVKGLSYTEIAHELQVSEASISLNMQYLREQAKGTIKEHVTCTKSYIKETIFIAEYSAPAYTNH
jgi:transcriptional regulator